MILLLKTTHHNQKNKTMFYKETIFFVVLFLLFACQNAEAQDMTRKERRALAKDIKKGKTSVLRKDSIVFVDKVREVEVIREVPKIIVQIKEVLRDTCEKDRKELRHDRRVQEEENNTKIRLAKIESDKQIDALKLQLRSQANANARLEDSLKLLRKLEITRGKVAEDTVWQDRKSKIVEARSKQRSYFGYSVKWIVIGIAVIFAIILSMYLFIQKYFVR